MSLLSVPTLTPLCRGQFPAALTLLLRSTIVLLLGLIAGRIASRRGPVLQAALYRVALVGVLIAALFSLSPVRPARPGWTAPLPVLTLPLVPVQLSPPAGEDGQPGAVMSRNPAITAPAPAALPPVQTAHLAQPPVAPPRRERGAWLPVGLISLWAGGAALLLGWFALGLARIGSLRRRSSLVTEGAVVEPWQALCAARAGRAPELRESPRIHGPLLLGWRRPAILLPVADLQHLDGTALRAVLLHELAHFDRRDYPWNLFSRLLCALLWPQPLLWALCRRMEAAGEEACDAAVVKQGVPAKEYARCLVTLAERFLAHPAERALGLGVAPLRSAVGRRVRRILAPSPRPALTLSRRTRAGIAFGAAPAVLLAVFLIAPRPGRPAVLSGSPGSAGDDLAHPILSVEAARHQLSFPLFVPRSLPAGASMEGVRVFVTKIADLSEVLHYTHSHRWIMHGYGLTILPAELIQPGRRGWFVNAYPDSPAAQAGIGPRARPLLALNGRPFTPGRDRAALRSSSWPLRVTFQAPDGRVRTVTIRKQTYVSGPGMPEIPHTPQAALLMTYRGPSTMSYHGFTGEIMEQPTAEFPRPARYARHLRVAGRDIAVYGTHEVRSAFWREDGVDLTLNNRAGMSEAQITAVIRAMHPEPPLGGAPPAPATSPAAAEGATIAGRVIDARGRPVSGIRVMAQAQRGVRGAHLGAEDLSHGDGAYRLTGLQTAPYNVIAEDPSQQQVAPADEGVAAVIGKTVHAPDLVMTPGAIVEGTVTDARSGQPLHGGEVVSVGPALPASSAMKLSTHADYDGRFRLRVAPGRNLICVDVVMGTGQRDRLYPAGNPPGVAVQVAEGETKRVALPVPRDIFPVFKPRPGHPVGMIYGG